MNLWRTDKKREAIRRESHRNDRGRVGKQDLLPQRSQPGVLKSVLRDAQQGGVFVCETVGIEFRGCGGMIQKLAA